MGGQVGIAPACFGSSLGSNPDISQKYKVGDISKGVANTLYPAKKLYKKSLGRIRIRNSGLRIRGFGRNYYGSTTLIGKRKRFRKRTGFQKDEVGGFEVRDAGNGVLQRQILQVELLVIHGSAEEQGRHALALFANKQIVHAGRQCSGSMTFWCGSGSGFADLCL
jgi:hypothetical protein